MQYLMGSCFLCLVWDMCQIFSIWHISHIQCGCLMLIVQGKSKLLSNDILQLTNNIMPIKSSYSQDCSYIKERLNAYKVDFHPSRGPKVMSLEGFSPVKLGFFFFFFGGKSDSFLIFYFIYIYIYIFFFFVPVPTHVHVCIESQVR